jgi:hypothetical protein
MSRSVMFLIGTIFITLFGSRQAETGKSPSVWIRDRTLLEARRLLIYTDLTISEIAYRLNSGTFPISSDSIGG